jgi:hypothetical protein
LSADKNSRGRRTVVVASALHRGPRPAVGGIRAALDEARKARREEQRRAEREELKRHRDAVRQAKPTVSIKDLRARKAEAAGSSSTNEHGIEFHLPGNLTYKPVPASGASRPPDPGTPFRESTPIASGNRSLDDDDDADGDLENVLERLEDLLGEGREEDEENEGGASARADASAGGGRGGGRGGGGAPPAAKGSPDRTGALGTRIEELRVQCEQIFGIDLFLRLHRMLSEASMNPAAAVSPEAEVLSAQLTDDQQRGLYLVDQLLYCEQALMEEG